MLTVKCLALRFPSNSSVLEPPYLGQLRAFTLLYAAGGETLQSLFESVCLGRTERLARPSLESRFRMPMLFAPAYFLAPARNSLS
jgi:hypothetical protein